MALKIETYSAGRRAGLTENLHIWTRPDRGSRQGYWLGKLSKTCFLFEEVQLWQLCVHDFFLGELVLLLVLS